MIACCHLHRMGNGFVILHHPGQHKRIGIAHPAQLHARCHRIPVVVLSPHRFVDFAAQLSFPVRIDSHHKVAAHIERRPPQRARVAHRPFHQHMGRRPAVHKSQKPFPYPRPVSSQPLVIVLRTGGPATRERGRRHHGSGRLRIMTLRPRHVALPGLPSSFRIGIVVKPATRTVGRQRRMGSARAGS